MKIPVTIKKAMKSAGKYEHLAELNRRKVLRWVRQEFNLEEDSEFDETLALSVVNDYIIDCVDNGQDFSDSLISFLEEEFDPKDYR